MKHLLTLLFASWLVAALHAATGLQVEAGASHVWLRGDRSDPGVLVLSRDEPSRTAPFVAVGYGFDAHWGVRLSYLYVDNARTAVEFGSLPGSMLPVVVWRHEQADLHVVGLAPEFTWTVGPKLDVTLTPQLNWVASRGTLSFSSTNPTVLLVAPQAQNDDGFTAGGGVRLAWSFTPRLAATIGYQYVDLDPSWGRTAHVVTGGLRWTF